ncbi:hypothetical protein [Maritimibacter sp. HL-12]|jgi:hypothetical protein|uniref:hypothetical protein n=1 Tax=Maritimibacter sp. HL-12 TaxID=1162418 RepID=UPI000A0EECB0|nr:hypothetical protein [Maritimibacter sp. HL-12]SMH54070.1 hypothetical protein SAMN05661107_2882 [Maritimibacter sp. HL-12]
MQDVFVAKADELVDAGIRQSGIPLTDTLKHYLAITIARFMRDHPGIDRLTIRVTQAMETRAPPDILRRLGDECLIATSLFEGRLRRSGGSLRHYSGLGQVAYEAAAMTEQAHSFPHMRDVIVSGTARGRGRDNLRALLDAARAGSTVARRSLAEGKVIAFPARRWIG